MLVPRGACRRRATGRVSQRLGVITTFEGVNIVMRILMQAWFRDVMDALSTMPRALGVPEAHAPGSNPDRLLVFGNGLAAGWGVATHELAIPGELARSLSALTGRGADVDIAAHPELKVAGVKKSLEDRDLAAYDAIIAIVGSSDSLSLTPRAHWRAAMHDLLDTLVEHSSASTRVLVVAMPQIRPVPPFNNMFGRLANAHATTLNAITQELCASRRRVDYVVLPPLATVTERLGTPERYRVWGRFIAHRLVPYLNGA